MLGERVVRVTVKPFMDMSTMIEERLTQCCVHVATVGAERPPVRAVLCGAGVGAAVSDPAVDRGRQTEPAGAGVSAPAGIGDTGRPADHAPPYDPLRLCIFATVALLGWLLGPVALLLFAGLGLAGYTKAYRAGLTRSKCFLRDTRLVIGYLSVLALAGALGVVLWIW